MTSKYYKTRFSEEYAFLEEQKKVIIHGIARGFQKIQLQKYTAITCYKNQYECTLLFHLGIPIYPEFLEDENIRFTLVFEGLPDNCKSFHLQSFPESGCWKSYDFERNEDDVYTFYV